MIHYCTVFRTDTGEIVSYSNFSINDDPEAIAANYSVRARMYGETGYDYIPVESLPETQYVAMIDGEPELADKPILHVQIDKTEILADGEDIATLTGLPNPCTIIVDDDDPLTETSIVEVEGGGFTFSTEDPGPYSFEVRGRFPFLPWKTIVVAS